MKWGIYDDYSIRSVKPTESNSILIRVLEPRYKDTSIPYEIKHLNDYNSVLELYFDDIRIDVPEEYKDRFVEFNETMANMLIDFIINNDANEINVHCNKGSSRSSAIMQCVALILDNDCIISEINNDTYYNPNERVINIFKSVFYKQDA